MFTFLVGFGVCTALFVTGILAADTVKSWLTAIWAAVKAKV